MGMIKATFHHQFTDEEMILMQKKPSPSAPPSNDDKRKANLRGTKFPDEAESQKQALQNLDQMVKNIYDTDLPGMCFMPPPSSRSDGYLAGACKWVWAFKLVMLINYFDDFPTVTSAPAITQRSAACRAVIALTLIKPISTSAAMDVLIIARSRMSMAGTTSHITPTDTAAYCKRKLFLSA